MICKLFYNILYEIAKEHQVIRNINRLAKDMKLAIIKQTNKNYKQLKRYLSKKKNQRKTVYLTLSLAVLLFGLLTVRFSHVSAQQAVQLNSQQETIQREVEQKKAVETAKKQLEVKIENEFVPKEEHDQTIQEKDAEIERLKAAKAAEKARLAAQVVPRVTIKTVTPKATSGSCDEWMIEAGIPISAATNALIASESGCNPNAVNKSSGACGIPQALPCSKIAYCSGDPVCQLKWMDGYTKGRYGSWENAYSTWVSRYPHWY